ncbi:hypothetical protein N7481_009794 [Penicillium waksmanii]|uniref:uncharacterized protein n=1 Tax=Penicillium waksmanii TaxID=69791 RepID=UPI00254971DD|nr:uncharacterized protein N7481_009794 [Penicillium waksmanii]KAJ5976087.1 hypothetical protein N7481_009794 [Penicillium waksmanii]
MSSQHLDEMAPWGNLEYRAPKPPRFELVQNIEIFFEEKLYTQALNLLFNTLASGSYASPECIIPLPPHLAIAVTFLVHPSTTTRASSDEEKEVAHIALRLLRLLGTLRNSILHLLLHMIRPCVRGGKFRAPGDDNESHGHDDNKPLNIKLGKEGSLWSRAEDFWHAVGWTFNCSVLHHERWERWQIWLEFMCDVLQDDWNERERIFRERKADEGDGNTQQRVPIKRGTVDQYQDHSLTILKESLIFRYISAGSGTGKYRRVVRAIFADGGTNSLNEFRQVFPKELKLAKSDRQAEKAKKRERDVNIDKDEYGDYLAQDESDDEATTGLEPSKSSSQSTSPSGAGSRRSKRTRRGTRNTKDPLDNELIDEITGPDQTLTQHDVGLSPLGGLDSLDLRKRLLGLLSRVCELLPKDFLAIDVLDHYIIENIRHLPLPIFQAFISPYVLPGLPDRSQRDSSSDEEQNPGEDGRNIRGERSDAEQTVLCELLLFSMLESAAPKSDQPYLDQDKLEECFLPFAAANASVVDNVKVSIILEALMLLLAGNGLLRFRPSLENAVQIGLGRRVERAAMEARRSQAKKDQEPLETSWLIESGDRLLFLMEVLQSQAQSIT